MRFKVRLRKLLALALTAACMISGLAGCDPVTLGTVLVVAKGIAVVAGTVAAVQYVESISLDNAKKRLEIQYLEKGIPQVKYVQLSNEQLVELQRTGRVQVNGNTYMMK